MDQEYYSNVYKWFEKCGIISNVRTHLRQNLISALKNKDLVLKRDTSPKSAKQYIYDLLIAEYLLNCNYAYTLSVFASEAPLLINFHDDTVKKSNGEDSKEKLQSDYVLHILETLGINPRDDKGLFIISQYIENNIPLLLCILKCIAAFSLHTHNSTHIIKEKSYCNDSTQTKLSWQSYNSDLRKLHVLKKKILGHKQTVNNDLQKREIMLKEQTIIMEQQLVSLNTKLLQAQNIMHSIALKEKQLEEKKQSNHEHILRKEVELKLKEKLLLEETNRLQREGNQYKKFEQDMKKLQDELIKVQKEFPSKESHPTGLTFKNVEVQTDFVIDTIKEDELKLLTKEKKELTELVQKQQLRIKHITQRALLLSRQVEDIQALRPTSVEIPTQTTNVNTVISESSSTEDILQDAKLRLKRLEEESLKADRYYYNFINTTS